jgi:hypothetical protein
MKSDSKAATQLRVYASDSSAPESSSRFQTKHHPHHAPKVHSCVRGGALSDGHRLDLVELLQKTLKQVEEVEKLSPDDPALLQLKRHILRAIAELKVAQNGRSMAA